MLSGLQLKDAAGILTGKDIEAVNALLECPAQMQSI